jgi:hypothetical protein
MAHTLLTLTNTPRPWYQNLAESIGICPYVGGGNGYEIVTDQWDVLESALKRDIERNKGGKGNTSVVVVVVEMRIAQANCTKEEDYFTWKRNRECVESDRKEFDRLLETTKQMCADTGKCVVAHSETGETYNMFRVRVP